jgi:ADP-ribose pyrophosphatase
MQARAKRERDSAKPQAQGAAINKMIKAKVLSQQRVFDGKLVKVRVDRVIEPAGHETTREIVEHPGAVCIVARPEPDKVLLIRQYRHAAGGELLEIPAGGLKDGEDPRVAALRELEEETGYQAAEMVERARFWTTPGFTTEFMYLYEATGLTLTQINPDDDEVIEVDVLSREEALRMIEEGRIQDAKTILGLLRILK